ncbi:MAG: hypothetical protein P8Y98_06605 [Anaerolineales bacterium]|jgi:hypothetical protein
MDKKRRSNLGAGLVLILLGIAFLVGQLSPNWYEWLDPGRNWPTIIIGVGLLLLIMGLMIGVPAMAVPACIVGGIGALLYWQNVTNNWASWSYAWALIPGFVGIGVILSGLLGTGFKQALREGLNLIKISMLCVAIFGSIFGANDFQAPVWPIVLIAAGALYLLQSIFRWP